MASYSLSLFLNQYKNHIDKFIRSYKFVDMVFCKKKDGERIPVFKEQLQSTTQGPALHSTLTPILDWPRSSCKTQPGSCSSLPRSPGFGTDRTNYLGQLGIATRHHREAGLVRRCR